jgi:hypothetical protein
LYELKLDVTQTGVKGSPTYVSKVYKTNEYRDCKLFENGDIPLDEIKKIMEI